MSTLNSQTRLDDGWSLFEIASFPVYEADVSGIILRQNKACAKLFGYTVKEFQALKSIDQILHAEDVPTALGRLRRVGKGHTVEETVLRGIRKDGSKFYFRPFPHRSGEKDGRTIIRITLLDVTEIKEAQAALKRSEERYALVVRGANDGIWDWDVTSDITYYSPRYKAMLGYEEHEFPNTAEAWLGRIHPEDKLQVLKHTNPCVRGEIDQFSVEYRMRHKDGSWRWILGRGGCLKEENDKPYRLSGTHTDITDRKLAEAALQESEEMHSALSRATFEGITISEDGCILVANHAASCLFDYEMGDFIGEYTQDLVTDEFKSLVRKNIQMDYEQPYDVVARRKDGSTFNAQFQGKVFFFQGRKTRVTAIRDITRRITAETRYKSLFDNAIEGIYQASAAGELLGANKSLATMLGFSSVEELLAAVNNINKQFYAIPEECKQLHAKRHQGGQVVNYEIQLVRKDHSLIWASESSREVVINGKIHYEGFIEDITERKSSERTSRVLYEISNAVSTTRDLSELYVMIHETLNREIDARNFYIALLDENQTKLDFPYCSDEYDELLEGIDLTTLETPSLTLEVIQSGKPLLIPQSKFKEQEEQKKVVCRGTLAAVWLGVPLSIKGKTIGAMAVQHYTNPDHYTDTDVKLMTAISEQVAIAIERKATESELFLLNEKLESIVLERTQQLIDKARELEQANKRLQELDKLKSAVISSISHELRTPLTSIRGFAKLTRKDFLRFFAPKKATKNQQQMRADRIVQNLCIVESEGKRLTRLVNDSLDLSKIESGRMEWNDRLTPPHELAQNAADAVSGHFVSQNKVSLRVECDTNLPLILVDPDRIQQVLINLLHNAGKFTAKGSVILSAKTFGDGIRFSVTDTGIGVPPKEQTQIFKRFHKRKQGDTIAEIREGAGLGLAICKEIVTHYGGHIWVESQLGKGSTFIFDIPVQPIAP